MATTLAQRLIGLIGIAVLLGCAWLLSSDRRRPPWRLIGFGLVLEFGLAAVVLKSAPGRALFAFLNDAVGKLLGFTAEGSRFLFGSYVDREFIVALRVLPTIIFFSALMTVLYHLGVMQRLVRAVAWVMQRTMKTSGPETMTAAANVFVGMTEAPLLVRPYLSAMTRSELMAVMVAGFATASGGILGAYVGMVEDVFPGIAGHILSAAVMAAPASLMMAKIMLPSGSAPVSALMNADTSPNADTSQVSADSAVAPLADTAAKPDERSPHANLLDAAATGAVDGLRLALNVGAMLLAFIALIALLNYLLGLPSQGINHLAGRVIMTPWSLERLGSIVMWPLAFVIGVPVQDCAAIAQLLAKKVVLNELVAFQELGQALRRGVQLQPRSVILASYALCGFANFGSIAIQIGGIGGLAPQRRGELCELGLRAMVGGLLAACLTATVAGIVL